jgi:hypothetical protein
MYRTCCNASIPCYEKINALIPCAVLLYLYWYSRKVMPIIVSWFLVYQTITHKVRWRGDYSCLYKSSQFFNSYMEEWINKASWIFLLWCIAWTELIQCPWLLWCFSNLMETHICQPITVTEWRQSCLVGPFPGGIHVCPIMISVLTKDSMHQFLFEHFFISSRKKCYHLKLIIWCWWDVYIWFEQCYHCTYIYIYIY